MAAKDVQFGNEVRQKNGQWREHSGQTPVRVTLGPERPQRRYLTALSAARTSLKMVCLLQKKSN